MTGSRVAIALLTALALAAGGGVYWASTRAHGRLDALTSRVDALRLEARAWSIPGGTQPTNLVPSGPVTDLDALLMGDHAQAPLPTDQEVLSIGYGRAATVARRELLTQVAERVEVLQCGAAAVDAMRFAAAVDAVSDGMFTMETRLDTMAAELSPTVLECAEDTPAEDLRAVADALMALSEIEPPRRHLINDRRDVLTQLASVRETFQRETWAVLDPDAHESMDVIERNVDQLQVLLSTAPLSSVPHRTADDGIERIVHAHECAVLRLRVLAGALRMKAGVDRPLEGIIDPRSGRNIVLNGDVIEAPHTPDICHVELAMGELDVGARVDRIVRARWTRVMQCKRELQVTGRLTLRMRLVRGKAERVRVVDDQTSDPAVAECVARLMEQWRMPTAAGSELEYTLRF